jgi:glutaminyl-peptide cyclotransferase
MATACLAGSQPAPPAFDGARASEHLRQLVAIGPRVAGSPGAQQARDYIRKQLNALGLEVVEQSFDARTPVGIVRMVNLRTTIPSTRGSGTRLLVTGHYDTKLFREFTFVGANDGGSSAAFLLELARVLKARTSSVAIELVFFDGEEAVIEWGGRDRTYGSRHYVETAQRDGTLREIGAMILVDMIGDRQLGIRREPTSTQWLTDVIWETARSLNRSEFLDEQLAVEDDHLPFLQAGVPAVDVIDFDYGPGNTYWHTAADTIDKVSGESLAAVGEVIVKALPEVERRLNGSSNRQ